MVSLAYEFVKAIFKKVKQLLEGLFDVLVEFIRNK